MQNEKQVKQQEENTTTTSSNPLINLIEDAIFGNKKIKTGFDDIEIPLGENEIGCPQCMNGYIENNGRLEYCSCYRKHLFHLKMRKSRIPKEYHLYKDIKINGLQAGKKPFSNPLNTLKTIDINLDLGKINQNFDALHKEGWNFLVEGPTGSGKTTFASLIGKSALGKNKSVLFLELEELRRMWTGEELSKELEEAKKKIYSVDVLILDDLGKEFASDRSDYMIKNLDSLIRQRTSEQRMIIYTTNITPDALSIRYDERIASLLKKQNIHYILHRKTDLREETGLPDFLS